MQKKKKKDYKMDMCEGPILKKMLIFSIPLMCSSVLQLLFNAADIVVVGRFAGDNSLAAVGSNTAIIGLITNLFVGLSIGANVLVAKYYGGKNEKGLTRTVHTSMLLSILSGLLLMVIGVIGTRQILKIGLPAGFQGILFSLSNVLIQSSVNSFGSTIMAGNSAAANVEQFVYFAMNAFYQATISFTSQNLGAGKLDRIKKVLITGLICFMSNFYKNYMSL